mmetsp:Transcript_7462/g.27411  ORF Transcript_7462/g.27411 Transcript_7462/m.27411 type:complete len:155 (+) Transcript_7462:115-579(+)
MPPWYVAVRCRVRRVWLSALRMRARRGCGCAGVPLGGGADRGVRRGANGHCVRHGGGDVLVELHLRGADPAAHLSFVGYLLAIVALVSSLYMLIYFLGRYRPRGMADAHKSEETSGHKVVSPLPQLGAPASLKKIEMAATTTVVSADPPQLEAP